MTPRYYWALDNCDKCATVPSDELALTTMAIGHDLLAFQPPEDDVVQGARSEIPVEGRNRRLRTECGSASSRAWRGIVGLGLFSGGGGASQE